MIQRRRLTSLGGVLGIVSVFAIGGCDGGLDRTDLEPRHVATYACALARDIDQPATDWNPTPGESEFDDEFNSAMSAVDLLGSASGTPLAGYADLMHPDLTRALTELDMETVDSELSSLQAACEDEGLPTEKADTSPTGRVSFACNLIADVNDADGSPREWFDAIGTDTPSEKGLILTKLFGATSLTGGALGAEPPGHKDLADAAHAILGAIADADDEATEEGIRDFHTACQEQ